ncbi:MAG: hypothetical protein AAFQ94_21915 [Bacteroidota bacterium]
MNSYHQSLNSELISLERKIKLLLNEHALLKEEIAQLKNENRELKLDMSSKNEKLDDFQNKIKISKIVGSMVADGEDTSDLKNIINDYIKEIDKCIAHLGN